MNINQRYESDYWVIGSFKCGDVDMVVVQMEGATCTMDEREFKRIKATEIRNKQSAS